MARLEDALVGSSVKGIECVIGSTSHEQENKGCIYFQGRSIAKQRHAPPVALCLISHRILWPLLQCLAALGDRDRLSLLP